MLHRGAAAAAGPAGDSEPESDGYAGETKGQSRARPRPAAGPNSTANSDRDVQTTDPILQDFQLSSSTNSY